MTPVVERLRVGVVGAGVMGGHHARIYAELPEAELVGVCDVQRERAEELAHRWGAAAFASLDDFLRQGLDAVSVAVPTTEHRRVAEACAEAGVHILLEKPAAGDPGEARKIFAACRKSSVRMMVGYVERFNPVVLALRRALAGREVMSLEITRVGPRPPRIRDVGVVVDLATHDIDLLRFLTGDEIERSMSLVSSLNGGHEDQALLSFRTRRGIAAHVNVNWITPFKVRRIRVATSDRFMEGDLLARTAYVYHMLEDDSSGGVAYSQEALEVEEEEPLRKEIREFLRCLRTGEEMPVSERDACVSLEIAQACLEREICSFSYD